MSVLNGNKDRFGGIIIKTKGQDFSDDDEFEEKLKASIDQWNSDGIRSVWIKICIQHSSLIAICAKYGFDFHHAQKGYVQMSCWLSKDEMDCLPEYANQYIGVAGFVVNDQNEVLTIQEKYSTLDDYWKLPGGHADKGEELYETARREVREETGVDSEFICLLSFRHQHNYRYGCSDIYYVCLMRPITHTITACRQEIAQCKWMPVAEYISKTTEANKFFAQCYLDWKADPSKAIIPRTIPSFNGKSLHQVYSVKSPL